MEMPWYSVFSFLFFFCLEATLGKDTWMRATSATAMVIFSRVLFRKLLDHNYIKVSSQQLRGTLTDILKDILWLKILWAWIKMRTNSLIKTLVNILKQKSTKMPRRLSLTKKKKKCNPTLPRTLHQNR